MNTLSRTKLAALLFAALTALVWYMHRANIQRLRQGTENRFGKRGGKGTPVVLIAIGVVSVLALYTAMRAG